MKYNFATKFPEEFQTISISEIHDLLGGPSVFHVSGEKKEPLFLSVLLHGNETTSFLVLQRLIKHYKDKKLPRDVIVFIGNTLAASKDMRHLPDQVDYNRIWAEGDLPEHKLARNVVEYAKNQNLFASIDIHNNTGKNPHYGCINSTEDKFLNLASHFGTHTVYFTEPHNVQSMAFSKFCTSITIESGMPGEESGTQAAFEYVNTILNLDELTRNPKNDRVMLHHTIARLRVNPAAKIDFENTSCVKSDISFVPTLDLNNFEVVKKNTHMGYAKNLSFIKIEDNEGNIITDDFLKVEDGELIVKRTFIPSMFTKDVFVMKEDCLGYLMEVILATKA